MIFFEDNLISLKALENRFGKNPSNKKLLQIFEMLNKLKFYMRNADDTVKEFYESAIANLRIAIEEKIKDESFSYVKE